MEEWKEYKLGEISKIQTGPFGSQLHQKDYVPLGTPCIMPTNIGNRLNIDTTNIAHVKGEDVTRLQRHCVKEGDIIYSRRGDIEKCAYILPVNEGWLCGTGCLRIRVKDNDVNTRFLAYQLSTCECKKWIVGNAVGSTMLNLNTSILKELPLRLPSKNEQDRLVNILKSLDDKIEVNRRINDNFYFAFLEVILIWLLTSLRNDNLEQQAMALFKSWFVDFEPFRDQPFVESELGRIPEGWKAGSLEDITTQKSERVGGREDMKVLSPVTTGQLMLSEEYFTKQVFSESIAKYKVVEKGDFAYNPARVNIGSLGRNNYDFDGCVSPVYVVFSCKDGYAYLFDLYRKTEKFKTEVYLRAIGGVRQSLNYKDFAFIQCIIPPLYIVEEFNAIYDHLLVMQKHTGEENGRLASLRDTLLPRLMSGELKVEDITL